MNQLTQAAAIAIIGGADGPTAIYIETGAIWQILVPWLLLFAVAVFFLVRSILKKRKLGIILSSVFCVILLLPPAAIFAGNLLLKMQSAKLNPEIKTSAVPWNEEEIVGHVFEFDDSEEDSESGTVETFYFKSDSSGKRSAACTFGKEGKMLASPIKSWQIDENGFLCIFDNSPEEHDCIKIEKIWLEEDVLYAVRNQQLAKYKYYSESALSEEK